MANYIAIPPIIVPPPITYAKAVEYFGEEDKNPIVSKTSFRHLALELATIWPRSREDPKHKFDEILHVRSRRPSRARHASRLEQLPNELLWRLFDRLDVRTIFSLSQTNFRLRGLVWKFPRFRVIARFAPDCLQAILRTRIASQVIMRQLFEAMATEECDTCYYFAGFLFLPTVSRCCWDCIQRNGRALSVLRMGDVLGATKLSKRYLRRTVRVLRSIEGGYTTTMATVPKDKAILSQDHLVAALKHARKFQSAKAVKKIPRGNRLMTCMATVALPYFDRATETVYRGLSCKGCWKKTDNPDDADSNMRYSREGFLKHHEECEEGRDFLRDLSSGLIEDVYPNANLDYAYNVSDSDDGWTEDNEYEEYDENYDGDYYGTYNEGQYYEESEDEGEDSPSSSETSLSSSSSGSSSSS